MVEDDTEAMPWHVINIVSRASDMGIQSDSRMQ